MFQLMSTLPSDTSALTDPAYHWTTRKVLAFLGALAEFGRVSEAAEAVGMSRQSAYRLRGRLGDGGTFARAWDQAQARGREQRRARQRTSRKATPLAPERDIFGLGR
jgi:hypothetical protein